jgi:catechol 2,3-dioxygenase-like lactoylglutathione lyase family enzyme
MKSLSVLLCLLAPAAAHAQSQQPADRTPFARVSGAFFALSVADLPASTAWYVEKLGMEVVLRSPAAERAGVVVLAGGGLTVELVRSPDARPRGGASASAGPEAVHGIFKAGVIVDDLDAALAVLRSRQVPIAFGPFPATARQKANAIIRDNSGNLIQLIAR